MSRSILDYFSQNYPDLLALAVQVCAHMTSRPEAGEDVLHQVAVALCQREAELADVRDYGAYIATCIRRAAINYARKESRALPADPGNMESQPELSRADEAYDYMEWVASLDRHLARYDPAMRRAFIAHYVDDVPLGELAKALGVSEKALSARFARMRRDLKKNGGSLFSQLNVLTFLV